MRGATASPSPHCAAKTRTRTKNQDQDQDRDEDENQNENRASPDFKSTRLRVLSKDFHLQLPQRQRAAAPIGVVPPRERGELIGRALVPRLDGQRRSAGLDAARLREREGSPRPIVGRGSHAAQHLPERRAVVGRPAPDPRVRGRRVSPRSSPAPRDVPPARGWDCGPWTRAARPARPWRRWPRAARAPACPHRSAGPARRSRYRDSNPGASRRNATTARSAGPSEASAACTRTSKDRT